MAVKHAATIPACMFFILLSHVDIIGVTRTAQNRVIVVKRRLNKDKGGI